MTAVSSAIAAAAGVGPYQPYKHNGNVASYEADRQVNLLSNTWSDAGGRGNALGALGGGFTFPTYVGDDGDGKPAFSLNGTSEAFYRATWGLFDPDAAFTMGVLYKQTASDDGAVVCFGDHADNLGRVMMRSFAGSVGNPGSGELGMFSSTSQNAEVTPTIGINGVWSVLWIRRSGSTLFGSYDVGHAESSVAVPSGSFSQQKLIVGTAVAAGVPSLPYTGKLRAFAAFSRSLDATERGELYAHWKAKWGGLP